MKNIFKKITEILLDIKKLEKAGTNSHHNYKYFSEAQLMAELRHRLASKGMTMTTDVVEHKGESTTAGFMSTVKTAHTFIDSDSGELFTVNSFGQGLDKGDKAIYKAITGATKYALMKNFFISDANDPEADSDTDKEAEKIKEMEDKAYTYDRLSLWLSENEIPEMFALGLAKTKNQDLVATKLYNLPADIIDKMNTEAGKQAILKAWRANK